mmetsp:Transcript_34712/g.75698  ORF Transcript_34712/g.75698 Transcript_34712/m.75698 type:complete len:510 (-) Transcript_34712:276-1805(-)
MAAQRFRSSCLARWLLLLASALGFCGPLAELLLFVQPSYSKIPDRRAGLGAKRLISRRSNEEAQVQAVAEAEDEDESLWRSLEAGGEQWVDGRELKKKGRLPAFVPDFVHLPTGEGLWIKNAPAWYSDKAPRSRVAQSKALKPDSLHWERLFDEPQKWLDYRRLKAEGLIKSNHPDFKSRDFGKSLWICKAPGPIQARLQEDRGQLPAWQEGKDPSEAELSPLWSSAIEEPEMWLDCRGLKKSGELSRNYPDIRHRDSGEGLWLSNAPAKLSEKIQAGDPPEWPAAPSRVEKMESFRHLWVSLLEQPELWQDYRELKSVRELPYQHPDFKHTFTGEGLWLSSVPPELFERIVADDAPVWALAISASGEKPSKDQVEAHWNSLFEEPELWTDYRLSKKEGVVKPTYPDFKSKEYGVALWLGKSSPSWVAERIEAEPDLWELGPKRRDLEPLWRSLFEDMGGWIDCRADKEAGTLSPRYPDFKQTPEAGDAALWLNSNDTPDWVHGRLAEI